MNVITAGFHGKIGDRGDEILHDFEEGDWVIAYANGFGAVGAGIAGSEDTYRLARRPMSPSNHRHSREVMWTRYVDALSEGVPFAELRIPVPRNTKMVLKETANARHIIDLLPAQSRRRTPTRIVRRPNPLSRYQARTQHFALLSDIEGLKTEARVVKTKRSRKLRDAAFNPARGVCCVCGRDFSTLLAGRGKRVLRVHHRDQLAARNAPSVTTQSDLAVVCANCHLLLHLDPRKALKVDKLREMLRADGWFDN